MRQKILDCLNRRLEAILDTIIGVAVVALLYTIWRKIRHLPRWEIAMIALGIVIAVAIGVKLILAWRRRHKSPDNNISAAIQQREESDQLISNLNEMHKRLMYFRRVRLSKSNRVSLGKSEDSSAILLDRLGLVELAKWPKFKNNVRRRITKAAVKTRKDKNPSLKKYRILTIAAEIKKELYDSKEWNISDALIICGWLEEHHWGIGELRDKDDKVWGKLYESVRPWLTNTQLNELIEEHINYSYVLCSMLLISNYSKKRPKDSFLRPLYEVLIGSPIDPISINLELTRITAAIRKQMKELQKTGDNR